MNILPIELNPRFDPEARISVYAIEARGGSIVFQSV